MESLTSGRGLPGTPRPPCGPHKYIQSRIGSSGRSSIRNNGFGSAHGLSILWYTLVIVLWVGIYGNKAASEALHSPPTVDQATHLAVPALSAPADGHILAPAWAVGVNETACHHATLTSDATLELNKTSKTPSWWSPFRRPFQVDTLAFPKCLGIAPGFDPTVIVTRNSIPKIKTLEDLRILKPGQKVIVAAPRFGLGNTLRNWVSVFYFGVISGRRIVVLHGGKFHGVYTSLCFAFGCSFDHIKAENDSASSRLLDEFRREWSGAPGVGLHNAATLVYSDAPVVLSFSYAFWDHWWKNNRTLAPCVCAAVGGCQGGGGYRAVAVNALISKGPSDALNFIVRHNLRVQTTTSKGNCQQANATQSVACRATPHSSLAVRTEPNHDQPGFSSLESQSASPVALTDSALSAEFDIGLHIRTRPKSMERPGRPYGRCRQEECLRRKEEEEKEMKERYLDPQMWRCWSLFVQGYRQIHNLSDSQPVSIFLATDNIALRDAFVDLLAQDGDVYYSNGSIAHSAVSSMGDMGRLPTLAEFFLMGKSHLLVEFDSYMSTFAQFAALLGNNSLLSIPRRGTSEERCSLPKPAQVGIWGSCDRRRRHNRYFHKGKHDARLSAC